MKTYSTNAIGAAAGFAHGGPMNNKVRKMLKEAGIKPVKQVKTAHRQYFYWGTDAMEWALKHAEGKVHEPTPAHEEPAAKTPQLTALDHAMMFNRVMDQLTGINTKLERLLAVWETK